MTGPTQDDELPGAPTPESTVPLRVVLVDDHLLLAESLSATLTAAGGIEVVAVAGSCAEGLEAVRRHQPDVCLLDQRLPDGLGTELLPRLREVSPATRTLLVTGSESDEVLHQALIAGSVGFVFKGQRAAVLWDAVRRAAAGETILSTQDMRRLLPRTASAGRRIGADLTPRERDVLRLLVEGRSTTDISAELFVSHATARNHIQALISKLGAHSRLEAVAVAKRENVLGDQ